MSGERSTAWYFGDDHGLYCKLRQRLPQNFAWGETGRRLNEIFEEHEDAFVNLEDGFDIDDIAWWESRNVSERGPYSTSYVVECCRSILFDRLVSEGGDLLILVEAADLATVLCTQAHRQGLRPIRLGVSWASRTIRSGIQRWSGALRFIKSACRRLLILSDLRRKRRRHPPRFSELAKCDVLFAVWTKAGDFPTNGLREQAHSMGSLPNQIRATGLTVGYIALPLDEVSDIWKIHDTVVSAHDVAILPDDTLGYQQILATAIAALRPRARPKRNCMIGRHEVGTIARMVLRREQFDWRAVNARLLSHVGEVLAAHQCRPLAVFHVYENQTWEKGFRQGFRNFLPETRTVGCHQSPVSKLYPNMVPSRAETVAGRWPDIVLTHGEHGRQVLSASGLCPDRISTAGLFREGAFLLPKPDRTEKTQKVNLLCATGPGLQECRELVRKAGFAAHQTGAHLIVNFHPLTTTGFRKSVKEFADLQCPASVDIEYSDAPIRSLLDGSIDAVLYADTNSGFEAVSSGARAINVLRDHALSFDKLPAGLSRRAYSVTDIVAAIGELSDPTRWPTAQNESALLSDCFAKFEITTVLDAAGLGKTSKDRNTKKEGATP